MSGLPTIIREIHAVLRMVGRAEVCSGNMYFIIFLPFSNFFIEELTKTMY